MNIDDVVDIFEAICKAVIDQKFNHNKYGKNLTPVSPTSPKYNNIYDNSEINNKNSSYNDTDNILYDKVDNDTDYADVLDTSDGNNNGDLNYLDSNSTVNNYNYQNNINYCNYELTSAKLKQAIVFSEIIGKPKCKNRKRNFR